ncbi:MAG: nucleotidyltransferase family protein [Promethearchaeota archaeon]
MIKKQNNDKLSKLKVLILVGGLGTRLRTIISDVPKPMAPIGRKNKPFLYYKLMQLKNSGLKNIVFCSGYMNQIIQDYFGDGEKFGINIEYSIEKEPLGTAGAIKNAEKFIDGPFFMMNGDVYINIKYRELFLEYKEKKADYIMSLAELKGNVSGGIVVVNSNMKIIKFLEKPGAEVIKTMDSPYINAGVYLLSPQILDLIPKNQKSSIEREIFPKLVGSDAHFYGSKYRGYFIDIGAPENYYQFVRDVEANEIN